MTCKLLFHAPYFTAAIGGNTTNISGTTCPKCARGAEERSSNVRAPEAYRASPTAPLSVSSSVSAASSPAPKHKVGLPCLARTTSSPIKLSVACRSTQPCSTEAFTGRQLTAECAGLHHGRGSISLDLRHRSDIISN